MQFPLRSANFRRNQGAGCPVRWRLSLSERYFMAPLVDLTPPDIFSSPFLAGSPCSRCNEDYTPICGSDNNTYGNHCMFACGRLANPSIVPSCRNECPCQFSNDADSRSPKAKFLNHLI
ncbi:hypothetical protein RvY_18197-4 [Ramazzottius varieornatus]|uniref:Kazal-like domain-containing protein n=1 Tax=Ramazzottius varieornatus TaxID=947166 RepID=A0A1D1WAS9_RAMVA|nr:hypothetical protein RvY_18197-4 [Ramazzottius varieornatus]